MPFSPSIAGRGLLAAGLLAAAAAQATPQLFTVGPADDQFGCTHTSLAAALQAAQANGPELDYVIVTNGAAYTSQALRVTNQSVEIWGGFSNCGLDADQKQPFSVINGNGVDPLLRIEPSVDGDYEVRLTSLRLRGGGSPTTDGGAVQLRPGTLTFVKLVLADTELSGNRAARGGGLYAVRGTAPDGQFNVVLRSGTRILDNSAANTGGGLYLIDGLLQVQAHDVRIAGNSAGGGGGGMALFNSVALIGNPEERPARSDTSGFRVEQNSAGTLGGGIYLSGGPTLLEAHEMIVDGNTAAGSGAGIAAANGARVFLQRDGSPGLGWYCPASAECTRLSDNQVGNGISSGNSGGALALYSGAQATLAQTVIRDNRAQDGAAVLVDGNSTLRTEGSVFSANRSYDPPGELGALIRSRFTAPVTPPSLRIAYTTFTGNQRRAADNSLRPAALLLAPQTIFNSYSSAFLDGGVALDSAAATDCAVLGPDAIFPPGNNQRVSFATGSPASIFLAPASANWRPRFDSPLTDICDSSAYTAEFRDRDLQPRCREEAKDNRWGACDIGAWENDQLFADDFEA